MKKKTKEKLWTALFPLLILFGTLLICSIPAYPATFDCEAGGYSHRIEAVNSFVDFAYTVGGKNYFWHIEVLNNPSPTLDWLLITENKSNYSILYPAYCKEVK